MITNLSYAANADAVRSLSIYLPTGPRQSLTLLVQGGEYFPGMLRYLTDLGYPVIAFNTRGDRYQEEIQDGFCALAWAHANAEAYGFDAKGIIPVGGSMFGGIAALLGMVDDPTPFLEECSHSLPETGRVRAVITLAGVFDYAEEDDFFGGFIESIGDFMGGTPEQAPENWAAASAITWVQGDEPPFLLVHGEADTNVAPHQSEKFAAALEEAGANVELVLLAGINHYNSVTDRRVFEAMASYLTRLEEADRLNEIGAGTFAFVSNRDGDYEIYLMTIPPVGGGPVVETQLTHNEAEDLVPDWSPDGEKLTFASTRDGNREIYVMAVEDAIQDPQNAKALRLTNHEGEDVSPVWSPDGTQIAFASNRDGDWEIYVMRADGTDLRQLTDKPSIESKASWSADGSRIAFDSGQGYERDIYVMDSDGANQELLVRAQGGWPAWSPDGTRIAYFDRVDGGPEIYVVNADGTNRTRLTRNSSDDWEPSWSPDGEWLLFVSGLVPDVFMMRADGSESHRLTHDNFEDWSPVWRPELAPSDQGSGGVKPVSMTYGGRQNDQAFDVLVTEDGGSLIAGQANNTRQSHRITPGNALLIRTDAEGTILWEKEYGGEDDAVFSSIIQAGEDEYVVLGEIAGSYLRDETDLYLVKVDGQGNEIWSRTFGGRGMDLGKMVRQTADGGYILVGDQADEYLTANLYESNLYLIKTDGEGNLVWSRKYGDEILYLGWGVAQTPDGGYVLTGWEAKTYDDRDVILIKTDESGEVEWSRTWDLGERDGGFDLILTSDGYVVMACVQSMGSGGPSAVLLKVDLDGNEIWNKLIGEEGIGNTLWHIVEDSDGGYVLAGDTHLGKAPRTGEDLHGAWLLKTDANGEILWQRVVGEGEYEQAHAHAAALLPSGGYLFVGDATLKGQIYSDILWLQMAAPAGEIGP